MKLVAEYLKIQIRRGIPRSFQHPVREEDLQRLSTYSFAWFCEQRAVVFPALLLGSLTESEFTGVKKTLQAATHKVFLDASMPMMSMVADGVDPGKTYGVMHHEREHVAVLPTQRQKAATIAVFFMILDTKGEHRVVLSGLTNTRIHRFQPTPTVYQDEALCYSNPSWLVDADVDGARCYAGLTGSQEFIDLIEHRIRTRGRIGFDLEQGGLVLRDPQLNELL